jgi:hypothetical protein
MEGTGHDLSESESGVWVESLEDDVGIAVLFPDALGLGAGEETDTGKTGGLVSHVADVIVGDLSTTILGDSLPDLGTGRALSGSDLHRHNRLRGEEDMLGSFD